MKTKLFCATVARPLPGGSWGLMNRKAGGFSSSCYEFPTLEALTATFAVRLGRSGQDEHSPFVEAIPE